AAQEAHRPGGARVEQRDDDERHPETEAVGGGEQPAPGRVAVLQRQEEHGGQGGADARRPAQPEDDPEQRRAPQPGPRAEVEAPVTLEEGDRAHEGEPHEHDDHPHDPGDDVEPGPQRQPEPAEDDTEEDEHGAEAEHEEEYPEEQPPLPGGAPGGRRRGPGGGQGTGLPREGAGHAAEGADVPGDEGQHAGRGEGDGPGEERDGDGGEEGAAEDGRLEGLRDAVPAHRAASARTSSIMPRTTPGSIWPSTRPATRPSVSRTTVVGIAWSGTRPWSAATPRAVSSWRLG